MSRSIEELEQGLLRSPFDQELRRSYAAALFGAGRVQESLEQERLRISASPDSADAYLAAARCCHALDDREEQAVLLEQARACADFDASDARLAEIGVAAEPGKLRAIAGGKAPQQADVISIASTDVVRFSDIVGMADLKKLVRMRIVEPFVNPGLFQRFKKRSGGGVLLYGPPGCGKTLMARAIATECEASFTPIGISDILSMWIGMSEANLAAIFDKAREEAPSVLFFDELDALAFSRSKASSDATRTLVNEFLNQLDGMVASNEKVLILGATNMPWDVDEAMKRPGRFDRQVFVPPPDAEARAEMLKLKLVDVPTDEFDAAAIGEKCKHFSGADMDGLIETAKDEVLAEILDSGEERRITGADLEAAAEQIEPTTLDWLKTARNLVKFAQAGNHYKDVEKYLRQSKLY